MRILMKLTAAVCLAAMLAGCAASPGRNRVSAVAAEPAAKPVIAVMPFQGARESPGSGQTVAEVMATELLALGAYTVVAPDGAASRTGMSSVHDEAPYVLTGCVTEYSGESGTDGQPVVAITARLVETGSGRILWSGSQARSGSAAWFQEDSLGLLTTRLCNDLAKSLDDEARRYCVAAPEVDYYAAAHTTAGASGKS